MKTFYVTCKVEYPEKYPEADVIAALEALLASTNSKIKKSKREAARLRAERLLKHTRISKEIHHERSNLDQPTPEPV